MERIFEMVLIVSIVFISSLSMKMSNDSMLAVERMSHEVQVSFFKSASA